MIQKLVLAASLMAVLGGCNTAGAPLSKVTIPEGQTRRIAFFPDLNADCTSRGPTVVRVSEQPANGKITIEETLDYPNYARESQRYDCNTRKVKGTRITYTPNPGFRGTDRVLAETIYPSGVARLGGVSITVK